MIVGTGSVTGLRRGWGGWVGGGASLVAHPEKRIEALRKNTRKEYQIGLKKLLFQLALMDCPISRITVVWS
jgi:hypothetical protein